MAFNALRFAICGSVLMIYSKSIGRSLPRDRSEWKKMIIASLLAIVGGNFFLTIALLYINGGFAPVITSLESTIFITSCYIFAGDKFKKAAWIGMAIGFSGLLVMFWPAISEIFQNPNEDTQNYTLALIFLFLTACCWGSSSYYVRHHKIETPLFMQTSIQYIFACCSFVILSLVMEDLSYTGISKSAWGAFAYVVIFTTVFGYAAFMYILPKLPAQLTATKAYIIPLISIITGYVVLGETLNVFQIIGGVIILGGVCLVNFGKSKSE